MGRPRKVYRTLQPPLPSPDGARTPGAWLGKVGATLDPLHRWGYLPELRTGKGEPHTEVELQPLVAPGVCRATVTTRTVFDPTPGHGTHSDVPAVT